MEVKTAVIALKMEETKLSRELTIEGIMAVIV
jgi:hypothetical protein